MGTGGVNGIGLPFRDPLWNTLLLQPVLAAPCIIQLEIKKNWGKTNQDMIRPYISASVYYLAHYRPIPILQLGFQDFLKGELLENQYFDNGLWKLRP